MKKTYISHKSRLLFNELGVGNVAMRKLAIALNMSVGNLNYHFRRKTDLITYLFKEFHSDELAFLSAYLTADLDDRGLKTLVIQHACTIAEYRFLWLDLHHFQQEIPTVTAGMQRIAAQRKRYLDADLAKYLNGFCFDMALSSKPFNSYQIRLNAAPVIASL